MYMQDPRDFIQYAKLMQAATRNVSLLTQRERNLIKKIINS